MLLRLLVGASPWILFGTLAGIFGYDIAAAGALVASLGLNLRHWKHGRLMIFEAASLGFFALSVVASHGFGSPLVATHGLAFAHLCLGLVAWGSLAAGVPFTLQYARDAVAPETARTPLFRQTNRVLTAVWGAVFLAVAATALAAPKTGILVAPFAHGGGVAFSLWFPRAFVRRKLQQMQLRQPRTDHPEIADTRSTGFVNDQA